MEEKEQEEEEGTGINSSSRECRKSRKALAKDQHILFKHKFSIDS